MAGEAKDAARSLFLRSTFNLLPATSSSSSRTPLPTASPLPSREAHRQQWAQLVEVWATEHRALPEAVASPTASPSNSGSLTATRQLCLPMAPSLLLRPLT